MVLAVAPVAQTDAGQLLTFLVQIGVFLGAALLLGQLARRVGLPGIVGELSAGVLLGPSLLGVVAPGAFARLIPGGHAPLLDGVGQFGVLLLVGVTGAHLDLTVVRRHRWAVCCVGTGGLVLPLAFGVVTGLILPAALLGPGVDRTVFAAFLGVALCVSAIPVIGSTLLELRLLHRDIGQLIITAAAVEDVVGWLLLSVVGAMATTGVAAGHLGTAVGSLALVLVATVALRPVVNRSLRWAARKTEPGVSVVVTVLLVVLAAAGTQAVGLEPVLGAFLCGILIGSSGWLEPTRLAPLRTFVLAVLAPLFFATAGLRTDLGALARPPVAAAAGLVLVVAVVGKFAGAYLGGRLARLRPWPALALGAGLNARGVIEVIIAMVGLRLGVFSPAMYTVVVLVAIGTSVMAPPMLRYTTRRIPVTDQEQARERALSLS